MLIANRILKAANDRTVQLGDGTNIRLRLSIGICDNETANSEEEMLKCADKAMYMVKDKGGNGCVAWE
jgi:diguanylate cyclase (GGDEF)-like protein